MWQNLPMKPDGHEQSVWFRVHTPPLKQGEREQSTKISTSHQSACTMYSYNHAIASKVIKDKVLQVPSSSVTAFTKGANATRTKCTVHVRLSDWHRLYMY